MKCIICWQEIPQYETGMPFLKDSMPKICEDCVCIIVDVRKNRR